MALKYEKRRSDVRWYVLLLVSSAIAFLAYSSASWNGFIPKVQAFQLWLLMIPLMSLVISLFRRRWLFSVLFVAVLLLGLGPNLQPKSLDRTAASGVEGLKVLSFNAYAAGASSEELSVLLRRADPDILVLVETSEELHRKLLEDGAVGSLQYRTSAVPTGEDRDTVIFSRYPLSERKGELGAGKTDWFSLPVADVQTPHGFVTVAGIHIYPPLGDAKKWKQGLQSVSTWAQQQNDNPLILAGDFNAVRAHPDFRELSKGLEDSDGFWPGASWPADRGFPAVIGIDHILSRDLSPLSFSTNEIAGSDHLAVSATFSFAR